MSAGGGATIVCSLALSAAGCTHDFDRFSAPDPTPDGAFSDGVVTDTSPADGRPADTPPPACTEPGGKTFAGHCYFPTPSTLGWDAAKTSCATGGGHLATVTSAEEQAAVESIMPGRDRWIGLSRPPGSPATEASFGWVTAEAMVYKNWASGEPNGSGECARLTSSGRWGDRSCGTAFTAICER